MTISEIIELAIDEYAAFGAAEDKRSYCVGRAVSVYRDWAKKKGVSAWKQMFAVKAIEVVAEMIYDAIADKFASDDNDPIITIITVRATKSGKLRLNWRKRRELGVTFFDFLRELKAMKADGTLDSLEATNIPQCLVDRLTSENPKLSAEAAKDEAFWEKLMAFLKFILPFLMFLI